MNVATVVLGDTGLSGPEMVQSLIVDLQLGRNVSVGCTRTWL